MAEILVRTLPSGQKVRVLSMGNTFFTHGDTALMLKYQTGLKIDDEPALRREALAIWEVFRKDVEQAGLTAGIVSANERPVGHLFWATSRSFDFVFQRGEDGTWREVKRRPGAAQSTDS